MAPELEKRYTAVRVADMCNRVEGVPVSKQAADLSRQWAKGMITGEEMIRALVAQHQRAE